MYHELLIICLLGIIIINYFVFKRDLAIPAISFNLGFLVCALVLLFLKHIWDAKIHKDTFDLILACNISISISSFIVNSIYNFKIRKNNTKKFTAIPLFKIKLLLVVQFIAAILKIYYLNQYNAGGLKDNLYAHTMALKFGGDVITYPWVSGFIISTGEFIALLLPVYFAIYILQNKQYNSHKKWLGINFICAMFISLLSSGRTAMLTYLITFLTIYVMGKQIKISSIKTWCKYILLCLAFLISFQQFGYIIGRRTDENMINIIGIYCGAQVLNLDGAVERGDRMTTKYPGERSFFSFYKRLEGYSFIDKSNNEKIDFLEFNSQRGKSLGNVYTALKDYYLDFGLWGACFVCALIGFIMQFVYNKAKCSNMFKTGIVNYWTCIYILLLPTMFMSFFSERFFDHLNWIMSFSLWLKIFIIQYFYTNLISK